MNRNKNDKKKLSLFAAIGGAILIVGGIALFLTTGSMAMLAFTVIGTISSGAGIVYKAFLDNNPENYSRDSDVTLSFDAKDEPEEDYREIFGYENSISNSTTVPPKSEHKNEEEIEK